jgi:exodeoxyribonuclease VII large subunit
MTRYPYFASFAEIESLFGESEGQGVAEPKEEGYASPQHIYRVSELLTSLNAIFRHRIGALSLRGEISNLSRESSSGRGHRYFRLKEEGDAVIDAAFFAPQIYQLDFPLENGMEVICHGRVTIYAPQGRFQFVVERMERMGVGAWLLAFQRLKEQLEAEGLFDPYRKRPLPRFPRKIGLVTSKEGAALRDILHVLRRRAPSVSILLAPSLVQGRGAAAQIVAALQALNQQDDLDLIILGRGGGSLEDLWVFNEEAVARAIAASRIPILTGIGHQTDTTIADFAADKAAPTPSAAAELAVPEEDALRYALEEQQQRLAQALRALLTQARLQLEKLQRRLASPSQALQQQRQQLLHYQSQLAQALSTQINLSRRRLTRLQERLTLCDPSLNIQQQRQRLSLLQQALQHRLQERLRNQCHRLQSLHQRLHDLSPLRILERGYAIATDEQGRVLRETNGLSIGQNITLRLQQGTLTLRLEAIKKDA